jgi:hypothetical protein
VGTAEASESKCPKTAPKSPLPEQRDTSRQLGPRHDFDVPDSKKDERFPLAAPLVGGKDPILSFYAHEVKCLLWVRQIRHAKTVIPQSQAGLLL